MREEELRAAARELGVREVRFLDYVDKELDRADPEEAVARIAAHLRRVRPHVVVSFDPNGAYGHPDHVAICQLTTAATVAAAVPADGRPGHAVSKLYYMAWAADTWAAYQEAFRALVSRVDGVDRQASPWADWAITTRLDTAEHWPRVWRAVQRHRSQLTIYGRLGDLAPEHHRALWGTQQFYRAYSLVNGGRRTETDLFAGLRPPLENGAPHGPASAHA